MNFRSKLADDFSAEVYTHFDDIRSELERRANDDELRRKVEEFFRENYIKELQSGPKAILSRTLATPNAELFYFLDLAKDLDLDPLILEYPDKFVAKNPDKYHLTRLFFYRKAKDLKSFPISTSKIIDFNKHEGKRFSEIPTLWGENIVDFHHNLLFEALPSLGGKVIDFSHWFDSTRFASKFYYLHFLALFVRNAVLFDNFLIEDKEESFFVREKFLPSFREVQRIFGVKPLIFPLIPFDGEKHPHWLSYPEHLKEKIFPDQTRTYPKIIIKDTKKYGLGVFADENIKKGTTIRVFDGDVISFEEAIRRIHAGEENQTDTLQIGLELDMDLDEISRTFNHSCNPNAGHRKQSELIAIRNIKSGEEITYDYSATIGPNIPSSLWQMECKCGQVNCRKILGNVMSIPKNQLLKYKEAGALQNYILKELDIIEKNGGKLPHYKKIKL